MNDNTLLVVVLVAGLWFMSRNSIGEKQEARGDADRLAAERERLRLAAERQRLSAPAAPSGPSWEDEITSLAIQTGGKAIGAAIDWLASNIPNYNGSGEYQYEQGSGETGDYGDTYYGVE